MLEHLQDQNAFSVATAVPFTPLRLLERRMLSRLQRHHVILEAGQGRYFVDPSALKAAEAVRPDVKRAALITAALAIGAGLIASLL